VAWHMRETGEFLVPRINGELYPEKPPLFFHLALLADILDAPNGGRIVEALSMTLLALLVAALAGSGKKEERLWGAFIFLGCALTVQIGKFGVIDALFVLTMAAGVVTGRRAIASDSPLLPWLGCYFSLAAGCLVKGPAIIPFAAMALLGSLCDLPRRASRRKHLAAHVAGLLLFGAVVASWVVPACVAGGDEYTSRLLKQITGRVTGARKTHIRPWYYYFPAAAFCFFPWTLIFISALRSGWKKEARKNFWLFLWIAGGFLLLSFSASKRERYLFFIIPALSLLAVRYFAQGAFTGFDLAVHRLTGGVLAASGVLVFAGGAAICFLPDLLGERLPPAADLFASGLRWWQIFIAGPVLGAAIFMSAVSVWRNADKAGRVITGVFLAVLGGSLAFDLVFAPALDPIKTGAAFTAQVKTLSDSGGGISLYGRHYDGRFNLLLHKVRIPVLKDPREVHRTLSAPEPRAVVAGWRRLPAAKLPSPFDSWPEIKLLASGFLGGRTMFLMGNQAALEVFLNQTRKDAEVPGKSGL